MSTFPRSPKSKLGYDVEQVDAFLESARTAYDDQNGDQGGDHRASRLTAAEIRHTAFSMQKGGYSTTHVDAALERAGISVPGREFGWFQDELAGAAPRTKGAPPDPREHSKLVARTVTYTRTIDGVPIFGSELLVGLNPEGQIGRLRLHWPTISPDQVKEARRLQAAVDARKWQVPKMLSDPETKILEVNAGVGHSAFSDPRFHSAAVVRVLFRREAKGDYPLVTTAYQYFDLEGREVHFSAFPQTAGTSEKLKKAPTK